MLLHSQKHLKTRSPVRTYPFIVLYFGKKKLITDPERMNYCAMQYHLELTENNCLPTNSKTIEGNYLCDEIELVVRRFQNSKNDHEDFFPCMYFQEKSVNMTINMTPLFAH